MPLVIWIFWGVLYACWWTLRTMIVLTVLLVQAVTAYVRHRQEINRP